MAPPHRIVLALALGGLAVAAPVAGAEPSRTSALSGAAPFAWEGSGVTGTPVLAITDDDTLLNVAEDGKLTVTISDADDTAVDLDVYVYKSNAAGEALGEPIVTGEVGGSDERVNKDVVKGAYLVRVTGWASLEGSYKGKATLVAAAPAPAPAAPAPPATAPTSAPPAADRQPAAKLGRLPRGTTKKALVFRGTASDDKGVSRVDLAIVRRSGSTCKQLTAKGRFIALATCSAPTSFLRARGTRSWSLKVKALPKGSYTVFARATDSAGQKQAGYSSANRRAFRVR